MRQVLAVLVSFAALVPGRVSATVGMPVLAASNEIRAVGTAELDVYLEHDVDFEVLWYRAHDLTDPTTLALVQGYGSPDNLQISSTASSVAIIIQQLTTARPFEMVFSSHVARIGGCNLPDCGRFEDHLHVAGAWPTRKSPTLFAYHLKAGTYRVIVAAEPDAITTARWTLSDQDEQLAPEARLDFNPSTRAALQAWTIEATTDGPRAGAFTQPSTQPLHALASVTEMHVRSTKEPEAPWFRFTLGNESRKVGTSATGSDFTYRRASIEEVQPPGDITMTWALEAESIDRRAAAWLLTWDRTY